MTQATVVVTKKTSKTKDKREVDRFDAKSKDNDSEDEDEDNDSEDETEEEEIPV